VDTLICTWSRRRLKIFPWRRYFKGMSSSLDSPFLKTSVTADRERLKITRHARKQHRLMPARTPKGSDSWPSCHRETRKERSESVVPNLPNKGLFPLRLRCAAIVNDSERYVARSLSFTIAAQPYWKCRLTVAA